MKKKNIEEAEQNISVDVKKESTPENEPFGSDGKRRITAVIPLRGGTGTQIDLNETLVRKCAESLAESTLINRVVISADDEEFEKLEPRFRNARTILRPAHLSKPGMRVIDVLMYTLSELEESGEVPDILVPVEITYPFRPKGIFDRVIEMLLESDYNTVIAGFAEYRVCWREENHTFQSVTDLSLPRQERNPLYVGLPGLACAVYPEIIRQGKRYGDPLGILQIDDPMAAIEVRTKEQLKPLSDTFYWPE
ncbi:MAG: hypothetical protein EA360_09660 [Balneolaceae bacterium]|nr:MAG: hypothetical protein EA360_09660 [Balneolaceae bacterium]